MYIPYMHIITKVGMLEGFREDLKTVAVVSHEYPLCGALYNSIFNQVRSCMLYTAMNA